MRMQQDTADPMATVDIEDESAATKEAMKRLTRLSDPVQMANFLSYGQWDLKQKDIERLQKDQEMKQRVGGISRFHY